MNNQITDQVLKNSDLLWHIFDFLPTCKLGHLSISRQWRKISLLILKSRIDDTVSNNGMKMYVNGKKREFYNVSIDPERQMLLSYPKNCGRYWELNNGHETVTFEFKCLVSNHHHRYSLEFTPQPAETNPNIHQESNGIIIYYLYKYYHDCYVFLINVVELPLSFYSTLKIKDID